LLVDRRELAGEAHAGAHGVRVVDDVVAEHAGRARRGLQQRGEHADRGGLAGAVGTEHAVHRAGPNVEVDGVDGARLAELLDELSRLYGRGRHAVCCSWGIDVTWR